MATSNPFEKGNAPKAPTAKKATLTASKAPKPSPVPLITETPKSVTHLNANISEDDYFPLHVWHRVLDIVEEIYDNANIVYNLLENRMLQALEYKEAKIYLESYVEHASEDEIIAITGLLKIRSIMKNNRCKFNY